MMTANLLNMFNNVFIIYICMLLIAKSEEDEAIVGLYDMENIVKVSVYKKSYKSNIVNGVNRGGAVIYHARVVQVYKGSIKINTLISGYESLHEQFQWKKMKSNSDLQVNSEIRYLFFDKPFDEKNDGSIKLGRVLNFGLFSIIGKEAMKKLDLRLKTIEKKKEINKN